jgi:hypothetical protein
LGKNGGGGFTLARDLPSFEVLGGERLEPSSPF